MSELQRELFPEYRKSNVETRHLRPLIEKRYFTIEQSKLIFAIIVVFLALIASYIMGYQRAESKKKEVVSFAKKIYLSKPVKINTRKIKDERDVSLKKKDIYRIQLVTYRSKKYAQDEIDKLRNKGFKIYMEEKRGYIILSVGDFRSRQEAEKALKLLKSRYRDAFIKRMKGG